MSAGAQGSAKRRIVPTFTRTASLPCHLRLDCSRPYLDHTSYPHIVETIISYASLPSLLVLRATCTEYRHAVDSALFSHVVACIPAGQTRGRDIELRSPTSPYSRLPFLPWQAAEPPGARKGIRNEARKRQLGYVHVVDFGWPERGFSDRTLDNFRAQRGLVGHVWHDDYDDGFDDATSHENTLRSASTLIAPFLGAYPRPRPLTVRRRNGLEGRGSVKLSASTYVDYFQLPDCVNEDTAVQFLVPSCRTYVLHLAYDPFQRLIWCSSMTIVLPPSIERVTLVMAPGTHIGPTNIRPSRPLGILRTLLWGFIRYAPAVQLELVGVENMHPTSLGFPVDDHHLAQPREIIAVVQGMIKTLIVEQTPNDHEPERGLCLAGSMAGSMNGQHPPPLPDALSRISLPTFEEWEASLPPHERQILAHPPEYQPLAAYC